MGFLNFLQKNYGIQLFWPTLSRLGIPEGAHHSVTASKILLFGSNQKVVQAHLVGGFGNLPVYWCS